MDTPVFTTSDFDRALGELLVAQSKLDARGLERALRLKGNGPEGLLETLPKLGLVAERDVAAAAATVLSLPLVAARDYPATPLLEDKLSARFLRDSRILPLAEEAGGLAVAIANPMDAYALDALRLIAGRPILSRVAVPAELEAAIERLYGKNGATATGATGDADALASLADDGLEPDIERLKDLASEAPVIRLVNQLIARASEQRASDIHIEPFEDRVRVRYRIDGALREADPLPRAYRHAAVSRIKIMARLNIAERRLPQDGRIKLAVRGRTIDLRIATVPTLHGESVVIRLLDRESVALDFAALGLAGAGLQRFLGVLDRPNGILLVTGPTGSGKTTTLYAALVRLNRTERKILTVEDPVEYQLEGINQVQVKPGIGLDVGHCGSVVAAI